MSVGPRESARDVRSWLRTFPGARIDLPSAAPPDPGADPYRVFLDWLEEAATAGIAEPNVGVLATVDAGGDPDARVLVVRDVTADGWWFSGPSFSPKGVQLQTHPAAALTFYWGEHGRQVRIAGSVRVGDADIAARDFRDRSATARAVAAASKQSAELVDVADYRRAVEEAAASVESDPDRVPEHWRAWCLRPDTVEFWQADPGRRHLRWRYSRGAGEQVWTQAELWP